MASVPPKVTVTAAGDPPVVSDIPDQSIAEGGSFTQITLDDYVDDPDNLDSEISWTYSGNTELTVDITNRVATITTPSADWNGSETITFTATDPGGLSDSDSATFTVEGTDETPPYIDGLNPENEEVQVPRDSNVIFHIKEMIQHLGHSTSGSHERYKSKQRLDWEKEFDPIKKFKEWIVTEKISSYNELLDIEIEAKQIALKAKNNAWNEYMQSFQKEKNELIKIINLLKDHTTITTKIKEYIEKINKKIPDRKEIISNAKNILYQININNSINNIKSKLNEWINRNQNDAFNAYNRNLYNEHSNSVLNIKGSPPIYKKNPEIRLNVSSEPRIKFELKLHIKALETQLLRACNFIL